jgi:hypothetical protein
LPWVPGGRGEAAKLVPIDVKAGDRILFGKWSGTEVKIDSVEYLIMKECDVMGCWLTRIPQGPVTLHAAQIHDPGNDVSG